MAAAFEISYDIKKDSGVDTHTIWLDSLFLPETVYRDKLWHFVFFLNLFIDFFFLVSMV